MISRILIFLGVVLLVFPTWLYLHNYTPPGQSLIYRIKDSLRIFRPNSNAQSRVGILISFFQGWGLLWLLTGIAIGMFGDNFSGPILIIVVIMLVFIAPSCFLFLAKRQSRIRSNETDGPVR